MLAPAETKTVKCGSCAAGNPADALFCGSCGRPITAQYPNKGNETASPHNSYQYESIPKINFRPIAWTAFIVMVCGSIAYWVTVHRHAHPSQADVANEVIVAPAYDAHFPVDP